MARRNRRVDSQGGKQICVCSGTRERVWETYRKNKSVGDREGASLPPFLRVKKGKKMQPRDRSIPIAVF